MTEKTFKTIILGQIPIWVAPYNSVQCYRDLGFDVFDDIIDHSYDKEKNPILRVGLVIEQVKKITEMSIIDLQQLKLELAPRFKRNLEQLKFYNGNYDVEFPQWEQILKNAQVIC